MPSPRIITALPCGFLSVFLLGTSTWGGLVGAFGQVETAGNSSYDSAGSSSISGYVFNDLNNNAVWEPWEHRLAHVHIQVERLDEEGLPEAIYNGWTDRFGRYLFENLPAGVYSITKLGTNDVYADGKQVLGMLGAPDWMRGTIVDGGPKGNDRFVGLVLRHGSIAANYLFAVWGVRPGQLSKAHLVVPEPSVVLMGAGGVFLTAARRKRRVQ